MLSFGKHECASILTTSIGAATMTETTIARRATRTDSFFYGNTRVTLRIRQVHKFTRHDLGCSWGGVYIVSGMDFRGMSEDDISECLPADLALGGDCGDYAYLRRVTEKYMVIRYGGQDDGGHPLS